MNFSTTAALLDLPTDVDALMELVHERVGQAGHELARLPQQAGAIAAALLADVEAGPADSADRALTELRSLAGQIWAWTQLRPAVAGAPGAIDRALPQVEGADAALVEADLAVLAADTWAYAHVDHPALVDGRPQLRAVLVLVIALLEAARRAGSGCAVCSWQLYDISDEDLELATGRALPL